MTIIDAFQETVAFFDALKKEDFIIDYALIGGLALSAWARPRTTRDVDIAVAISKTTAWSDIVSLIEMRLHKRVALQKGTQRTNIKEKLSFVIGQIEVDVISTRGFELAFEAISHGMTVEVFGKKVKVVTPEYLILLKLLPLSDQDVLDIQALTKKAEMKRLVTLAEKHHLLPKLERVLAKGRRINR